MTPYKRSETSIRVLVVNHSGIIREGLCLMLERFTGIEVVASIGHLHGLGEIARQERVDVALIDALLPGEACFDVHRRLQEGGATTRVVILSVSRGVGDVRRALESGASGFLLQDAGAAELEIALHAAATGQTFLCPTIIKQLGLGLSPKHVSTRTTLDVGPSQGPDQIEAIIDSALRQGILREGA
ncbi:DNA-binding response regulator, NarL/FixJ family, contains REC and HTH domains [Franzmannia pantelleriensis]|uniref:DNA-binding response regulator, NarL/FixJ family, contains REC and HTH domains n=1 Tax=Franzmannia pantelleriensis TaxID=48727 RepID=A0A1G9NHA6_9GAMM|nr:response regulator transcription factor [Halomonas pantelleriensis]SDL85809.1 DNA-binding response regulator, NarL/FixJ family, contains REC and HTH domains [Halomonas pantelleriensis]